MAFSQSTAAAYLTSKNLLRADNLTLVVLVGLATLFGFLAFKPIAIEDDTNNLDLIAQLTRAESGVKRKSANGLAWGLADDQDKLYAGDQIFTEKKSTATVRFNDGSEIAVAENSLIKIERKGDKTTIDMSKGFISGKLGKKSGLTLKMGNTKVALNQGAEIQINVDPNNRSNTKLTLLKGNATIDAGNNTLKIKTNQILSVGEQGAQVSNINIKPLLPAFDQRIDAADSEMILFKWESSKPLEYRLLIARDSSFRDILVNQKTSNTDATIKLSEPGKYVWKVTGKDQKTGQIEETITAHFTVSKTTPPELLSPASDRRFLQVEEKSEKQAISFLWRSNETDVAFEIQIAKDRDFTSPIIQQVLDQAQFSSTDMEAGTYYWRVRTLGKNNGRRSSYSEVRNFSVDLAAPLVAPTLISPDHGLQQTAGQMITLKWNSLTNANGYRLEILTNGKIVITETLRDTSFIWKPQNSGHYQWRVGTEDSLGREIPYSEFRAFIVTVAPPTLVSPKDQYNFVLNRKTIPIAFSWTANEDTSYYDLQVAKDPDFKGDFLKFRISANHHIWDVAEAGTYFWRVAAYATGIDGASYSSIRQFSVNDLDLLPPPSLLDRYYFELSPITLDNKVTHDESWKSGDQSQANLRITYAIYAISLRLSAGLFSIIDLLTGSSTAFAQVAIKSEGPVDIQWQPIEGAIGYDVEIAPDAKFSRNLVKRRVSSPRFYWPDAKPGRYYMRASSVDTRNRPGPFSQTSELFISYQPPKLLSPADATKLTLKPGVRNVTFRWQTSERARRYAVEISMTGDFSKPLIRRQLENREGRLALNLDPGSYFWRVQAIYHGSTQFVASEPFRFTVNYRELPAPTLESPANQSTVRHTDGLVDVNFQWQPVSGADQYDLEISPVADFSQITYQESGINVAKFNHKLTDGEYFWRVRGRYGTYALSQFSSPWSLRVKARPTIPSWIKPGADEKISYREAEAPLVVFAWQPVQSAKGYDFELARDANFTKIIHAKHTELTNESLKIDDGFYFARIRARSDEDDDDDTFSAWSEPRQFSQIRRLPDGPSLVYPSDGQKLYRQKILRLAWKQEDGFSGYRLVIAKDSNFKSVVTESQSQKNETTLKDLPKGKYYWYVEGQNQPMRLAVKSDIQMFTITTPPESDETTKLRVQLGYAPSIIVNSMVSSEVTNSLAMVATNSLTLDTSFWVSRSFGFALAYHRKSAELFSQKLEDSSDQKPLAYTPQHAGLLASYRAFLGRPGRSMELHGRAGYLYKTFYTYYPESRTAIGLMEAGAQHLQVGVGTRLPLSRQQSLESGFDYAKPISANPTQIRNGSNILFDVSYHHNFYQRFAWGTAYRFGRATYEFADQTHAIAGDLEETTHSVIGTVEYGF